MMELGRVVVKTRGSEAGNVAVIVDILDGKMVMIDGNVKRKLCNVNHLEPMAKKLEIKAGASTEEIKKLLEDAKIITKPKQRKTYKKKDRKAGPRPKKSHKKKTPAEKKKSKKKMTEDEKVEAALAKV